MAAEDVLRAELNTALTFLGANTPDEGTRLKQQLVERIATAVQHYTTAKLLELKVVLVTPGTFTGAGTGIVTVTAPGLAGYNP